MSWLSKGFLVLIPYHVDVIFISTTSSSFFPPGTLSNFDMSHIPKDTASRAMINTGNAHMSNIAMEPIASELGASVAGTSSTGPPTSKENASSWRHQWKYIRVTGPFCGVSGEFPSERPVARSFDIFFDLCMNKRLSKQSWCFETLSCPLWRHRNVRYIYRADSRSSPSQWETALLCDNVSHWLGASLESAMYVDNC